MKKFRILILSAILILSTVMLQAANAELDQPVTITSLKYSNQECSYRIKNGTDETIDSVRAVVIPYGSDGKAFTDKAITYEYNVLTKDWGIDEAIKAGDSGRTMTVNNEYVGYELTVASRFAIGVISYHVKSGRTFVYDPENVVFYITDGTVKYPESGSAQPFVFSDSRSAELDAVRFGYSTKTIYPWTAQFYGTHEGLYVTSVANSSLAEKAGIQSGDIILTFDGNSSLSVEAEQRARWKLLHGESVEVTYQRAGQIYTVSVSTDMEPVVQNNGSSLSIADELLKYADLLERGLITQEEFDAFKQKLLES
ncbi:MAG: PDZ domain-containing protein [Clostridiales bacterium]|nr:PDZ domain-containing protein [Clostridiales bacterium]